MIADALVVDQPLVWPQACTFCQNGRGPQLDTLTENASGMRQYVCGGCAGLIAVKFGLVAGEELQRLQAVDEERAGFALALDREKLMRQQVERELEDERKANAALREAITVSGMREQQLEDTLNRVRSDTMAQLDAVAPEIIHEGPFGVPADVEVDGEPVSDADIRAGFLAATTPVEPDPED